jgi:integrase
MAKVLTPITIQNAKPKHRQGRAVITEISDGGCRGLRLVLHPTGHRSWIIRYRFGGRSRKLTLGNAIVMRPGEPDPPNALTLATARKAASDALHKVATGIDPASEKAPKPAVSETFAVVAEGCFAREAGRLRSADRVLHELRRLAFPTLGSRPIATIRRSDVVRLLDDIQMNHGVVMADAVLAAISKVMHDHARRSDDYAVPLVRGMRRSNAKERERTRVLNDDELQSIWKASESDDVFSAFIRFLLLTACRRMEAGRMVWSEIQGGVWTLPPSRNKTKKELTRPLSQAAQDLLDKLPHNNDNDYVFAMVGGRGIFKDFANSKRKFDKRCNVTGWTLHDLRRTARTLMSRAGVLDNVSERCLGHLIGGSKGVYDRHTYLPEMLHAFEALARLIQNIIDPQLKVRQLRG